MNDMTTFATRDDVLTLLIHLGYLTYNSERHTASIPNREVSQEYMEHEKEILLAQAKKENPEKPENIIEKMIIGRLNKEMKEICLLDQVYVQDSDLTVAKYVEKVAKENGANMTVKRFVRFETGEGLEKKNEDFAAEVAAQMNA